VEGIRLHRRGRGTRVTCSYSAVRLSPERTEKGTLVVITRESTRAHSVEPTTVGPEETGVERDPEKSHGCSGNPKISRLGSYRYVHGVYITTGEPAHDP